ncbi:MAG: MotA/TolQ/ExbB proton channel family protein [Planctomycetaceae bacterium]|nr:MotA/TolQ/ExbB proton channel family protein [Planctomycetaceae bacterium]
MLAQAQEMKWFDALFIDCGFVGWVLWLLSILAVALIVQYFMMVRRMNIMPTALREQVQQMFEERQYRAVIDLTENEPSFMGYVMHAALNEAAHGYPAMERAMEEAAEERTTKLLRNIEWLNLIGNVAPMLGLLGTVQGMIMAFFEIVKMGTVAPELIAKPIGLALVTTMEGLMIAIPVLSCFTFLRNRIDSLTSEAMTACQELIATFRPAGRS